MDVTEHLLYSTGVTETLCILLDMSLDYHSAVFQNIITEEPASYVIYWNEKPA